MLGNFLLEPDAEKYWVVVDSIFFFVGSELIFRARLLVNVSATGF